MFPGRRPSSRVAKTHGLAGSGWPGWGWCVVTGSRVCRRAARWRADTFRRVPLIQTCTVEDPLHGIVIVHTDIEQGWIEVAGDGFPAVHLRRSETADVSPY